VQIEQRACSQGVVADMQVLMNATTDYAKAVDTCIGNKAGLPTLFGIFIGKNKTRGIKAGSDDARQLLEGCTCTIANLLHYTAKRCAPECVCYIIDSDSRAINRALDRSRLLFPWYFAELHVLQHCDIINVKEVRLHA
jgi:hypothetical protein